MSATGQLRRKEPEFFLILQAPHREMLPRDVRIDGRAGSVGACLRVAGIQLERRQRGRDVDVHGGCGRRIRE